MTVTDEQLGADIDLDVEHFRARVLQDALAQATADHWLARAAQLEQARPRPGDHHGQATPEQLAAADQRLSAAALACRRRAALALPHRPATDGKEG